METIALIIACLAVASMFGYMIIEFSGDKSLKSITK